MRTRDRKDGGIDSWANHRLLFPLGAFAFLLAAGSLQAAEPGTNVVTQVLSTIPEGYHLQAYDDCGVSDRQPHVQMIGDCYLWTFNTSDTDAGLKERSAVFSYKGIQAIYTNLDPALSYVLALTYSSDHVYKRVQSLEADDGVVLHDPYALPKAKATRVIVRVPQAVTEDGKMTLSWKIHGEVNATVSIIELWANGPAVDGLRIVSISGLTESLQGQVQNLAYDPIIGAKVRVSASGQAGGAETTTGSEGMFRLSRKAVEASGTNGNLILTASYAGQSTSTSVPVTNLFYNPVHYRPMPVKTAGLKTNTILLDGTWALRPLLEDTVTVRQQPLSAPGWSRFKVPGQWLQQGFDIPQDKPVAVAAEFTIPQNWSGKRVILRFDAVHAGTCYWLNGRELGYSENLFTPVEWDITAAARPGQTNRLDLEMKVATVSEALSYSSAYAFHNLGGIDRSVRLFALPPIHIRQMDVKPKLDSRFTDGELRLRLSLAGADVAQDDLWLGIKLLDQEGRVVKHSMPRLNIEPFTGSRSLDIATYVNRPRHWTAEKPDLYRLVIELNQGRTLLERIERNIGFRNIEIRGRQLYVNGQRIKIAGVCHHEFDPLSGRADTARHAETDVRLLKESNLNLIRTAHYPPTAELVDAADRLGMYVEVEAPFCWVGGALDSPTNLLATLTPTSAMVDYHQSHPSVIMWSVANESHFNLQFLASSRLLKELDPTRPTTFNHDFANSPLAHGVTDIANVHYPSWPFEKVFADDPRPVYFGEYFFPVCHEQTDVAINPGLRELWGHGQAEPESEFARDCAAGFLKPPLKPGLMPGGWSAIYHSDHMLGGAIWASHDDAFYFSETNHAGYAWHHGFWGLIDYWRRPKPEWWLARHIFSPVWLETREADFAPGQRYLRVPVENRHAFTDFSDLEFTWELNKHRGRIKPELPPGKRGELRFPIPAGVDEGDHLLLHVRTSTGVVLNESLIRLGKAKPVSPLQVGKTGAPQWVDEGGKIVIKGSKYAIVFDRDKGDFDPNDPRHNCAVTAFPAVHVTRYDFGDLNGPKSPNYAVFPDAKTRRFQKVEVKEESSGLRLVVHNQYDHFSGSISWLLDNEGQGLVACDYSYSGPTMDTREAGIRFVLKPGCDELKWRRWSEWGVFPEESISRTEGIAKAHRDRRLGPAIWNQRPAWPWSLDETALGTADFRSIKYHIYDALLAAPNGSGLSAHANADVHFRAALAADGVAAHALWRCPLGQVPLKSGDRLHGQCEMRLLPAGEPKAAKR